MKYLLILASLVAFTYSCSNNGQKPTTKPDIGPDSIALVRAAILKDSLNPDLWQELFQLQMAKGDTAGGLRSLKLYTFLVPQDADAWLQLEWLLADQQDPQVLVVADSLSRVDDVLIRTRAKYITGLYYANLGQNDKALAIFDSVILNNYTFIDAYMEKGILLHDQKKYNAALKTFRQAFQIVKNDPEIYYWIGKCYEGLGNKAEAEDWQKKYEALK